jgi:hypothetical protein
MQDNKARLFCPCPTISQACSKDVSNRNQGSTGLFPARVLGGGGRCLRVLSVCLGAARLCFECRNRRRFGVAVIKPKQKACVVVHTKQAFA